MKKNTPSQRLRGALYILWSMELHVESFEEYYERQIKYFIKAVSKEIKKREDDRAVKS